MQLRGSCAAKFFDPNMSHVYEFAMVSTWTPTQEAPGNAHWRVLPPLRPIRLPDGDRTVWLGDETDRTFECFKEENEAPQQLVSMWGAPPTTNKVILNVHVELKHRSFDMTAAMLSGVQAWQETFFYSQHLVASQIYVHCRAELLAATMVQSTQDIVLVGRNGVIDPRSIVWEGRFYSSSMVCLQYRPRRRLRQKLALRAFFMNSAY